MTRATIVVACVALGATPAPAQLFYGPPPDFAWELPIGGGFVTPGHWVATPGFWGPMPPPPPAALWASPLYDPWAMPPGWWEPSWAVVVRPRVDRLPPRPLAPPVGEALPAPKPLP